MAQTYRLARSGRIDRSRPIAMRFNGTAIEGYAGDTIDRHCLRRGLAHALVEIRQNLIDTPDKAAFWGKRLARILAPLLGDPILHEKRHYGAHPVP